MSKWNEENDEEIVSWKRADMEASKKNNQRIQIKPKYKRPILNINPISRSIDSILFNVSTLFLEIFTMLSYIKYKY